MSYRQEIVGGYFLLARPVKPKVHYASWSETCSKPAGDLLAS